MLFECKAVIIFTNKFQYIIFFCEIKFQAGMVVVTECVLLCARSLVRILVQYTYRIIMWSPSAIRCRLRKNCTGPQIGGKIRPEKGSAVIKSQSNTYIYTAKAVSEKHMYVCFYIYIYIHICRIFICRKYVHTFVYMVNHSFSHSWRHFRFEP